MSWLSYGHKNIPFFTSRSFHVLPLIDGSLILHFAVPHLVLNPVNKFLISDVVFFISKCLFDFFYRYQFSVEIVLFSLILSVFSSIFLEA